jgi:hypothetical protein
MPFSLNILNILMQACGMFIVLFVKTNHYDTEIKIR